MKTEWINSIQKTFTEEDKKKLIKMYEENNSKLIQCQAFDNYNTISYDEKNNSLEFETECENGYCGGCISTDTMSNETIMNIIRILLDILWKRMQNKKNDY